MTECFIVSCLRHYFLLGSPSITRKQDGKVPVFSVLRTLPKTFPKHPRSARVLMTSQGPVLSKQLPNSEREMFTCTSLSLWYPIKSLENKTLRHRKQIFQKKKKMRQIIWETHTCECLAVGTLHSRVHFSLHAIVSVALCV